MSILDDIAAVLNSPQAQEGMRAFSRIGMPLELVQRDKENFINQQKLDMLQQQEMQKQQRQAMASQMLASIMSDGKPDSEKLAALAQFDPDMAMQLYKEAQKSTLPFAGTSMDAQVANLAYQEALQQGLDDFSARKYAADKIRTSQMDLRLNPQTGALESIPRSPIFGNAALPLQTQPPTTQPPAQKPDYTPSSWEEIYSEPVVDMNDDAGRKLGESLAKTSGLLQQAQMAARAVTSPIDQLIKEATGYNSNISNAIGGEGLAGADKAINLFIEGAVADMMVGRSVDEQKRKRDLYSPKSFSKEGALGSLITIVDDLKSQTDLVQKQINSTTNINEKTKLTVERLIPLQKRLNEGVGAIQVLQQSMSGGQSQAAPQTETFNLPQGWSVRVK